MLNRANAMEACRNVPPPSIDRHVHVKKKNQRPTTVVRVECSVCSRIIAGQQGKTRSVHEPHKPHRHNDPGGNLCAGEREYGRRVKDVVKKEEVPA